MSDLVNERISVVVRRTNRSRTTYVILQSSIYMKNILKLSPFLPGHKWFHPFFISPPNLYINYLHLSFFSVFYSISSINAYHVSCFSLCVLCPLLQITIYIRYINLETVFGYINLQNLNKFAMKLSFNRFRNAWEDLWKVHMRRIQGRILWY